MARFTMTVGEELSLTEGPVHRRFTALEHPGAVGMTHSMEGRKGFVFHLRELSTDSREYALKVMKKPFREKQIESVCAFLTQLKVRPGLQVCERICLTDDLDQDLLQQHPTLIYSVLMPWAAGISWFDLIQDRSATKWHQGTSEGLARSLSNALFELEKDGLAHCDISAANVLLDAETHRVELIDFEDLYSDSLAPPNAIPAGTPGYQHKTSHIGQWNHTGDRFSAAILLSEILGWYDPAVRNAADGESYFDPKELQQDNCARFALLRTSVGRHRPALVDLLDRAWTSTDLESCPSLREWRDTLLGVTLSPIQGSASEPPKVRWLPTETSPVARWNSHTLPPVVGQPNTHNQENNKDG